MKTIVLALFVLGLAGCSMAQDPVDKVFETYNGKDGFTTVNITGDLLKMCAQKDVNGNDSGFMTKLTSVKILAQEKDCKIPVMNFHTEIYNKLDKSAYKELLVVKEHNQDVNILAKESNGKISEFIIIVGGSDDNVLVQVKGEFDKKDLARLSDTYDIDGFKELKHID